jgi:hypothetical protein
MKRLSLIFLMMVYLYPTAGVKVRAEPITFTAGDIVSWMAQQGDSLK